jgi:drug/metabolite transporter (DMT)-like permease
VVMQSLWAAGFYYLDPGFMVLLSQTSVIWVAGFSILFFHQERGLIKSWYFRIGLLLSAVGVVGVTFFKDDFFTQKTITGILIVFASSFCWAIYILSAKIAFKEAGACRGFSVVTIYTVIGLAVLASVFGDLGNCLTIESRAWFYIVISAVLAIAISHVFYYAAIRRIGAAIPAVVLLLLPFTVLAISSVVFQEKLNVLQWVFGAVLLIGAGLSICAQNRLR